MENLGCSIGLTLLSLFFLFEFEKAVINGTVDMVEKNEAEDDEKLKIKLADGLLGPGHY